jgi:glyoxylase-like metal-dependent hydrolase (beta-lactamase superfamily II)
MPRARFDGPGAGLKVHHLNCISTCPLGGALMDGKSRSLRGRLACHCLLVETSAGLVLVDTGLGLHDCAMPRPRLSGFFLTLLAPEFREEMTAARQVEALGFRRSDVRHVVLSHLDFDHAGGLDDFPGATVHMLATEQRSAESQATLLDRMRYRPLQWSTRRNWRTYGGGDGDGWFGFTNVRALEGVPPEIVMIPLIGHTLGHAGVAVKREHDWLLYTADAYFYRDEMRPRPHCTPGLRFYQWMMQKEARSRHANQARLRALRQMHGDEVTIFCAHDPVEFERLSGRAPDVPARAQRPGMARAATGAGTSSGDVLQDVEKLALPDASGRSRVPDNLTS